MKYFISIIVMIEKKLSAASIYSNAAAWIIVNPVFFNSICMDVDIWEKKDTSLGKLGGIRTGVHIIPPFRVM